GPYSNPARSATMLRSFSEAPRGWYSPVSHSLIVCCRVFISRASSCCVSPRCCRRARICVASQTGFRRGAILQSYTETDKQRTEGRSQKQEAREQKTEDRGTRTGSALISDF